MLFFQNFIEHLGFVHSVILARRKSVRAERTTITDTEFSSLILAQCTAKRDRERESGRPVYAMWSVCWRNKPFPRPFGSVLVLHVLACVYIVRRLCLRRIQMPEPENKNKKSAISGVPILFTSEFGLNVCALPLGVQFIQLKLIPNA